MRNRYLAEAAICTMVWFLAPPIVYAAGAEARDANPNDEIQEIIVTAQRHAERLQDVPMSITTFSQENLDQTGLRNIDDMSRLTPGLTFLRNGGTSSVGNYNDEGSDVSVRGVDSTAGTSTIGIYIDDTPIQTRHLSFSSVNPYPALFDLERVEVLKGPQGTLFGAGSEGGTIRFITPEPNLTKYEVYARTEVGQIDGGGQNYEAGIAVGGPLIENVLAFRFSVSDREDGGWVNRVNYIPPPSTPSTAGNPLYGGSPTITGTTEKDANWHDTQTARLALKWVPMDGLTVSPSIYAQTLHINDTATYWSDLSNPSGNSYNNGNAQRDPSTDPWYLSALKVDWHTSVFDLVSNTSYFSRSQHSVSDYTQWINTVFLGNQYPYPLAGNIDTGYFTDHQNNFTQEVRISSVDPAARFTWSGGVFYSHAFENATEVMTGTETYNQPQFSVLDKQSAAFGEANFKFTDSVNFTAGARVSRMDYTGNVQESGSLIDGLVLNTTTSGSDNPVTPRFVLNYQPTKDSLYYASVAKGFRPCGINPQLPGNCTNAYQGQVPSTFNSDSLWQYEIGSKQSLLDHRLQVNASIYYLQWKNIQQFIYFPCGLGYVPNLGEVTGKGGDIDIAWRASSDLTLGLNGSYTDSYYDGTASVLSASGATLNLVTQGDHLPASPWNLSANAEYVFNQVNTKPYLRADYQYATAQRSVTPYLDQNNALQTPDPTLPGLPEIRILSLRAGLRFNGVDLSLFASNVLNYHTPVSVFRDYGSTEANAGAGNNFDTNYFARGYAPATYGVTVAYRY